MATTHWSRGLAVALWCALSAELAAHEGHGVPDSKRPLDGLGASAAFDAHGVLWSVSKGGNHVVLHHSADGGRTWSWGQAVNTTPEPVDAEGDARPRVVAGPKGELYVSWTQPPATPAPRHIRFARSLDGGKSFDAPQTVRSPDAVHRIDAMTVDRKGRVFIAWATVGDGAPARKPAKQRGAALYYAVSEDRGASFRGDVERVEQTCDCCGIAFLPRTDDTMTASWRAPLNDAKGRTCPDPGTSLVADGEGRLHGVWSSSSARPPGAFYGRLRDGAIDGVRRFGGAKAVRPDLAIDGNRLAIAWVEFDGEHSRLRGMRSDDAGAIWREVSIAMIAGAADAPRILVHDGGFRVFWNTRGAPRSVHALP